ncbi:MAG: hypothetical protein IT534_10700 [Bauldia sp.]|nr:hypothetical protein [Bauldia sp.]
MSVPFALKSKDKRVSFVMYQPRAVYRLGERFNSYSVLFRGQPVTVGMGFHDNDVSLWVEFFEDIAAQAIAWKGARYHESDGGILRMKGVGDGTGGIDLRIELWEYRRGGCMIAEGTVHLERRTLKGLAEAARRFFAQEPDADDGASLAT